MTILSDEQRRAAEAICAKYPNPRSAMLPLLFLVQSVEGYVTEDGMREVADILGLTPAEILAASSFYSMLKRKRQGEYLISVCRNITCTHNGARHVIDAFERRLGIEVGETTEDGRFSLEAAECLATCDGAPSIQINYEDFYNLTPQRAEELVDALADGEDLRSARGEVVKAARAIARETAMAGAAHKWEGEAARTVGGEAMPGDMAPGFRPKVRGAGEVGEKPDKRGPGEDVPGSAGGRDEAVQGEPEESENA